TVEAPNPVSRVGRFPRNFLRTHHLERMKERSLTLVSQRCSFYEKVAWYSPSYWHTCVDMVFLHFGDQFVTSITIFPCELLVDFIYFQASMYPFIGNKRSIFGLIFFKVRFLFT